MLTRKLGSLLRGKATPFQIIAACVFGALLGFAPAPLKAPALYVLLIAGLLVVNANLGLALLVLAGTKLLSFVATPLSFQLGRLLLDGPTSGIAKSIVNAPILAWCGFDYYTVAGGQLIGLIVGALLGVLIASAVARFRKRMIASRDNPGRIAQLASKPGAKFLVWLFFGGTGKKSWEEKLEKRVGNPVRIWGAALMVVGLVGVYLAQQALAGPVARRALKVSLEEANGATVDVGGAELDLGEGRFAVSGLALADPNALASDLFRADRIEADVDEADLLRRRVHVARVVVSDAWSGAPRETPGEIVTKPSEPEPEPESSPDTGDYTLEDVVAEYETWKERLGQVREWLDRMSGAPSKEEGDESFAERLERQARELGFGSVRAGHLVDEAPTFRLSELLVESFETTYVPERVFDLKMTELSSQPGLVDAPPTVELASRDGAIRFEADLAPVSRQGGDGALRFAWTGLSVDAAMQQLKLGDSPPLSGGTLDLALDGAWDGGRIGYVDLPLRATLRNTTLSVSGVDPTPLDELVLPIQLKGPIDAPKIHFDSSMLKDALVAAGKQELANKVNDLVGEELGDEIDKIKESTGIEVPTDLDGAKDALDGLFGKKKKD